MSFKVGQKVSYPNHGVCAIEKVESKKISNDSVDFYSLRVLAFNSLILVPTNNAESIGIRPVISNDQSQKVLSFLSKDFDEIESDWKIRIRDFLATVQTGEIFAVADVLKKLTFLTKLKTLSFREQRLLEKTKFLVASEIATASSKPMEEIEVKVDKFVAKACEKHSINQIPMISQIAH